MRITPVTFVEWINERCGKVTTEAVLPPQRAYWQPDQGPEPMVELPPATEPDKGLRFDMYA